MAFQAQPLRLAKMEVRDYQLITDAQWNHGQGSLGQLVIQGKQGFEFSAQKMAFDADTPTWQEGKAYFPLAKVQASQIALSLPGQPGPQPALTLAVPQAGRFSLSFALKDLGGNFGGDNLANLEALKNCHPVNLSARYEDASLAEHLLVLATQKAQMEPEEYRAKLIKDLPPLPGALDAAPGWAGCR